MPTSGENSRVGVYVSLEQIYDVAKMAAAAGDGARSDIAALRKDFQTLDKRLATVESDLRSPASTAYLKRTGAAIGLLVAGVASGWAAFKGG